MAQKMSTGLCNALLGGSAGLAELFDLGFVKLYSGAVPATADASIGAAVEQVVVGAPGPGTGVTFDTPAVAGVLSKAAAETWEGTVGAGGLVTFYRLVQPGDTGVLSTTEVRIQGTIGMGGSDMNLGDTTLIAAAPFVLNYFTQSLVPS
jgi:hypothetical protein